MAQFLDFGNGHDGAPSGASGTINSYAACTGTAGQAVLTTTLAASAGDQILIHQSYGTGVGTWELARVVSDAGATLNLVSNLVNSYVSGAQAILIPQYSAGTLSNALTATAWNGTTGGIIALLCNGPLTISGTPTVSGVGYRGNPQGSESGDHIGKQGEAVNAAGGTESQSANGVGGGGGGSTNGAGGGGGGGHAAGGSNGTGATVGTGGGAASDAAALTTAHFGGAGGTGGQHEGSGIRYGGSGDGSGFILIIARYLTVTGGLNGNGEVGGNASIFGGADSTQGAGGGGGGAGGAILIKCQTAVLGTNLVTATGGAGGSGGIMTNTTNSPGGAGAVGRIRLDYLASYTGSTNPAISAAQDTSLTVAEAGFLFNLI